MRCRSRRGPWPPSGRRARFINPRAEQGPPSDGQHGHGDARRHHRHASPTRRGRLLDASRRHIRQARVQRIGTQRALRGVLFKTLHHQRGDVSWHSQTRRVQQRRRFADVRRHHRLRSAPCGKRMRPREQLVRHHAPRVQISARVGIHISQRLLRRHVRRRANRGAQRRERVPLGLGAGGRERLGDAEVGDHRRATRQQHVLRLDVAMHNAALVRIGQRLRDVAQNADRLGHRHGARHESRAQRVAAHEGHGVVGQPFTRGARRQHRHDVRVLKRRPELDLARETLGAQ